MAKMQMVCRHCGSENVLRDAWASWNPESQKWELENVFDSAFCEACDGEVKIKSVPYVEEAEDAQDAMAQSAESPRDAQRNTDDRLARLVKQGA